VKLFKGESVCMPKFNRDQLKGFVMGASTVVLFASLVGTAFAAGKLTNIKVVQGGIKIYMDSKLVVPTDGNGKVVEPFIYDGTTYLPMRALSNALTNNQKPVKWDSATSSVYIGQAPVAAQTDLTELNTYDSYAMKILKESDAKFTILDKTITPFNHFTGNGSSAYAIYMLNSNYSEINGQYTIPYTDLNRKGTSVIRFLNVSKTGEETLIQEVKTSIGEDPQNVKVNVSGVEILKISIEDSAGSFYNVSLAGMK